MEAVRAVPDHFAARMTSPNRLASSADSPKPSRGWLGLRAYGLLMFFAHRTVSFVVGAGRLDEEPISLDHDMIQDPNAKSPR